MGTILPQVLDISDSPAMRLMLLLPKHMAFKILGVLILPQLIALNVHGLISPSGSAKSVKVLLED